MLALPMTVEQAQSPDGVRALKESRAIPYVLTLECGHEASTIGLRHESSTPDWSEFSEECWSCIGAERRVISWRPLQSANAVRAQPTNEPSEERQNKKGITE
jgi:hypothetical protein